MDFLSAAHNGDVHRLQSLVTARPELVTIQDSNGFTGLALAAEKGHAPACEALLQANSQVDAKTTVGNTPVSLSWPPCLWLSVSLTRSGSVCR